MKRFFSLEMESRSDLDKINIEEGSAGVLLEGKLGELDCINILEDALLEIKCRNGALRLNIDRTELKQALNKELTTSR